MGEGKVRGDTHTHTTHLKHAFISTHRHVNVYILSEATHTQIAP